LKFDGTNLSIANGGKIYIDGGGDTYIEERGGSGNQIAFVAGGNTIALAIETKFSVQGTTDLEIQSGSQFFLDGGGDTYLIESSANNISFYTGGTERIKIASGGQVTMPTQPCVFAANTARDSNVTGDDTRFTVDYDGEIFDQGGDFASDTFTAPITGRYLVCVGVMFVSPDASNLTLVGKIIASNRNIFLLHETWLSANERDRIWINGSRIIDMDATDTFTIQVYIDGMGSDTVHIEGSAVANCYTSVSIELVA